VLVKETQDFNVQTINREFNII